MTTMKENMNNEQYTTFQEKMYDAMEKILSGETAKRHRKLELQKEKLMSFLYEIHNSIQKDLQDCCLPDGEVDHVNYKRFQYKSPINNLEFSLEVFIKKGILGCDTEIANLMILINDRPTKIINDLFLEEILEIIRKICVKNICDVAIDMLGDKRTENSNETF